MWRTRVRSPISYAPIREWVDYVGFPDSPYYALAGKYLGGRAPSLLTFGAAGGLEAAKAFYDALKLVKRLVNIGDTRTLCCHPASTTHRQMTREEQLRAGVRAETIRLSVGIEHAQDIIEDLDQALHAAAPAARRTAVGSSTMRSGLKRPHGWTRRAGAGNLAGRLPAGDA